ncbi:MarR family transcriptional regulator [Sphaerotilus hippei]|uniref:MarR family transcriptional regulator n=2 Tax=Sphaerotilus hippei TaxID=744406 RepID=A0A318HAY7_9BURK|nr:MarR family transcriptional regulator [Sphaerotilus hippei]
MSEKRLDDSRMSHLLGFAIARARVGTNEAYFTHVGEPLGLKPVDFTLLMLLSRNDQVTQKDLVQALNIPAPHMTLIIARLLERGLVARERSSVDRRAQVLELTESGRTLAEQAHAASLQAEAPLRARLSPAEWAMLMELLHKCGAAGRP